MDLVQTTVQVTSIPAMLVFLTLPAAGVLISLATVYLIRKGTTPAWWKDLVGLAGSLVGSTGIGALLNLITNVRSVNLTPAEAGILTLSGAVYTWIAVLVFWALYRYIYTPGVICFTVLLPLAKRCGPRCAGQAIRHIFLLRDKIYSADEFKRRFNADSAWDEFATALASATDSLQPANVSSVAFAGLIKTDTKDLHQAETVQRAATDLLTATLRVPLADFNSYTGANKFRFSIWRIDDSKKSLERIWMLPNRDQRSPIPIWRQDQPSQPASHAALVMQTAQSDVLTACDPRLKDKSMFPQGKLGSEYIEIRGSPLICPVSKSPWGVLYIDLCHGSVPLNSEAAKLLSRRLVEAIQPLAPYLQLHTLKDTR